MNMDRCMPVKSYGNDPGSSSTDESPREPNTIRGMRGMRSFLLFQLDPVIAG
jgi:hypothetical protein